MEALGEKVVEMIWLVVISLIVMSILFGIDFWYAVEYPWGLQLSSWKPGSV